MKILHATNAAGWSGGLEQMRVLISELGKRNVESCLVCPPYCELIPKLEPGKTSVEKLSMYQDYDLVAAYKLYKIILRRAPDIVHAHHPIAHAVSLIAMAFEGKPAFVVSRRVSFSPRKNPFSRWKYGSKRIDAYSVVSQSIKDTLVQCGVRPEKIHVIYSAFQKEKIFPKNPNLQLKAELQIPAHHFVAGKIANAALWKGQQVFLQAAKIALKKNPNITFLLAGKDTQSLQTKLSEMGIEKSVRLLGFRNDVPEIISILDLSVNSAISGEGLSGAMRESLAMQIPVIASDIAGNREIVRDNETGLLVPANNPNILADKILYATQHKEAMKVMALKGKQWVDKNTSSQTMVENFLKLYSSLLK